MTTIAQEWAEYRAAAYPDHLDPMLEGELRRAFYAAFGMAFNVMNEVADLPSEENCIEALAVLHAEWGGFMTPYTKG